MYQIANDLLTSSYLLKQDEATPTNLRRQKNSFNIFHPVACSNLKIGETFRLNHVYLMIHRYYLLFLNALTTCLIVSFTVTVEIRSIKQRL